MDRPQFQAHLVRLFGDPAHRVSRVVAADADERRDARIQQHVDAHAEVVFRLRRVGGRGAQDRSALGVDATHIVDRQGRGGDLARHQALEAVVDAQHLHAVVDRFDGCRVDHAVDAGRRPAADQNAEGWC